MTMLSLMAFAGFGAGVHHCERRRRCGGIGAAGASSLSWKRDGSRIGAVVVVRGRAGEEEDEKEQMLRQDARDLDGLEIENQQRREVSLRKPLTATGLYTYKEGHIVRVAYQGLPGAFSEAAVLKAFPLCEAVPCDQFEAAFKAVQTWVVDKAVLPIESCLGGTIHQNYDLLLDHRLHIVGEVHLAVNHCLMALPGVKKDQIKRVLSHPNALAQCHRKLEKLGVIKQSMDDTAAAAEFIASNILWDSGAIASARAAELYGLHILEEGMQDIPENVTRFLILDRQPIIPEGGIPSKTSIVFALDGGATLFPRALAAFSMREIRLTKIECRSQRRVTALLDGNFGVSRHFSYLFYLDVEASMEECRMRNAIENLQELATFTRVLGSYPKDTAECFPWREIGT